MMLFGIIHLKYAFDTAKKTKPKSRDRNFSLLFVREDLMIKENTPYLNILRSRVEKLPYSEDKNFAFVA